MVARQRAQTGDNTRPIRRREFDFSTWGHPEQAATAREFPAENLSIATTSGPYAHIGGDNRAEPDGVGRRTCSQSLFRMVGIDKKRIGDD
jgi:hypothetical protein